MKNLISRLRQLRQLAIVRDNRGANMVEYIIMVGLVALIALAGFSKFGGSVSAKINQQADSVSQINGQD